MDQSSQVRKLKELLDARLTNMDLTLSPEDAMLGRGEVGRAAYFGVAQSALRCIRLAMLMTGREQFQNILDFGCGHGRVLRALKAAFPRARLTACDLAKDAVDFCARTFGATPVYASTAPAEVPLVGGFDLIWCGSVITCIPETNLQPLLTLLRDHLSPGGLLIFTTHGRLVAEKLRSRSDTYGLEEEALLGLLEDYDRRGVGYARYPKADLEALGLGPEYGISLTSPAWIGAQLQKFLDLRLVMYCENLWDATQDVVTCVRAGVAGVREGFHDLATCGEISGWAWDSSMPDTPIYVDIYDGDKLLATVLADRLREDLRTAGKGQGHHAFVFPVPRHLKDGKPHSIWVKISGSDIILSNPPKVIVCPPEG
jgi:SAM-dependent methyltransferase